MCDLGQVTWLGFLVPHFNKITIINVLELIAYVLGLIALRACHSEQVDTPGATAAP